MSKNQLVPVKPNLPAVFKKEPNIMLTPVMTYTPVDPLHYSCLITRDKAWKR